MALLSHRLIRALRVTVPLAVPAGMLSGCGSAEKISSPRLVSLGIGDGAMYWQVEQALAQEGYRCFVTGLKRENFDCTQTRGTFPTCVLRITFIVDDANRVSRLKVAEPACIGML